MWYNNDVSMYLCIYAFIFHIHQINMSPGCIACWVFLSCLEVLNTCERFSDSSHVTSYTLYTASLWEYARKKVRYEIKYLYFGGLEVKFWNWSCFRPITTASIDSRTTWERRESSHVTLMNKNKLFGWIKSIMIKIIALFSVIECVRKERKM